MASLQEELKKRQKTPPLPEGFQYSRGELGVPMSEEDLISLKGRNAYKESLAGNRFTLSPIKGHENMLRADTARRNEILRLENEKNEKARLAKKDASDWETYNKWEGLAQQDDLKLSDFQEKENLFKQFAGQENFIKEKIFALSDVIENNTTDDATKTSLIRVMEEIAASHNQFKESQQDTYALIEKDKAGTLRGEDLFTNQSDIDEFNLSRGITTAPSTNVQGQTDIQAAQSDVKTKDTPKWSGEVGSRTLNKISPIQQKLLDSGHSQEGLVQLMEKNQEFQANRPKVTDLLKIFKK